MALSFILLDVRSSMVYEEGIIDLGNLARNEECAEQKSKLQESQQLVSRLRQQLSDSEKVVQELQSEVKDFEQSMLELRGELSENKASLENSNSLLKQKEQTASEVKAQLEARDATVGELNSKLIWAEFTNKVLLKDDERDKKENATLEQKLSQYKQPMNKFKRGTLI